MKMKILVTSILVVTLGAVGVVMATSSGGGKITKNTLTSTINPVRQETQGNMSVPATIDGAKNPELIPDHVTYSLLFRFIAGTRNAASRERIRPYIRQMGLGDQKCRECPQSKDSNGKDADIEALIAAADEYQRRVSVLDKQAIEIKRSNWPNPSTEVMAQLKQLQQQKEVLVTEIAASLPRRLSARGLKMVRKHVNERVKSRTKMRAKQVQLNDLSSGKVGE